MFHSVITSPYEVSPIIVEEEAPNPRLNISASVLERQVSRFRKGFPGTTSYAVKANDTPVIIKHLHDCGISHFDVASIQEMAVVRDIAPTAVLHYHNPVKSGMELHQAIHQFGCSRFAVDHMDELAKIIKHLPSRSGVEIAVRFRDTRPSGAIQAFKSKFGANDLEAAHLVKKAKDAGFRVGLTFHPGSQTLSPEPYSHHIETASQIARNAGATLDFLNVGGGFPAEYAGLSSSPLEIFFDAIKDTVDQNFDASTLRIECEPGRSMVSEAGTLKVSIKAVRKDRREIFLNDGIYGGLMEVSQFPALRPAYKLVDEHHLESTRETWTAYGPTCDPIDVLPFSLHLPIDVAEGCEIEFYGVGAYSTATATRFNGYGAIDVTLVD